MFGFFRRKDNSITDSTIANRDKNDFSASTSRDGSDDEFSNLAQIDAQLLKLAPKNSKSESGLGGCIGCSGNRCGEGIVRKLRTLLAHQLIDPNIISQLKKLIPNFSADIGLIKKGDLNPKDLLKKIGILSSQ